MKLGCGHEVEARFIEKTWFEKELEKVHRDMEKKIYGWVCWLSHIEWKINHNLDSTHIDKPFISIQFLVTKMEELDFIQKLEVILPLQDRP